MTSDGVFVSGATGFIGHHLVIVENLLRPDQDYFFESPIFDDRRARQLLNGVVEPRSATALEFLARAADTSRTSKPRSSLPPAVQTGKRIVGRARDVFP